MNIRVLDVHAEACPTGSDECEHWNAELHPNETVEFTLQAAVTLDGHPVHDTECRVLSVSRDNADNVEIVVNGLDYQAKAMQLAAHMSHHEDTLQATLATTRRKSRHSALSTSLWLLGCFAVVAVQAWASIDGEHHVFALASAVLILAMAART